MRRIVTWTLETVMTTPGQTGAAERTARLARRLRRLAGLLRALPERDLERLLQATYRLGPDRSEVSLGIRPDEARILWDAHRRLTEARREPPAGADKAPLLRLGPGGDFVRDITPQDL